VDKQTYLIILLIGQLALIILDLRERHRKRHGGASDGRLRPGSILFLVSTIIVYGGIQFGGLALVPNAEELLVLSRQYVGQLLGTSGGAGILLILLTGVAGFYFAGLCDYLFHHRLLKPFGITTPQEHSLHHTAGPVYDQDFPGTLTFGRFKLPERVRRRFQLNNFCYLETSRPS